MDTDALAVFVETARIGSLSGAARHLAISPMLATRRLAALEKELGVRLLHRTTRSSAPTSEGAAFLPFAESVLDNAAGGRAILQAATGGASGVLKISASFAFGRRVLMPLIGRVLDDNPDLAIDLQLTDGLVDLVAGGFDLGIRIAPLAENSLIARRLAPSPRLLVAAPGYLARNAAPQRLADLRAHQCLGFSGVRHWAFQRGDRETHVAITGRFCANSIDALRDACLAGYGLAILAQWNIAPDLAAGHLVALPLVDATPMPWTIWAVYPTARQVLPKIRVFIAALEAHLAEFHAGAQ